MNGGGDFLAGMAASSRERVVAARRRLAEPELLARAARAPRPPPLVRSAAGFDLIAELKLRSPAAGALQSAATEDLAARVGAYAAGGAAAVSVLTEPSRFDGSMAHLEAAARVLAPLHVPAMRKDFLVEPYQVMEARLAGAGGVLVILRMLPRGACETLIDCALELGLFALLEAFDEADIALAHELVGARAAARPQLLVGVNCRDLVTLQVVKGRLEGLASLLPRDVARVAESGVASADDAGRIAGAGYDLALVGSALMAGSAPRALAGAMLEAGRAARARAL
jgi:indole-3-glycerol phosphate synthase